jgi:hypothetical protein
MDVWNPAEIDSVDGAELIHVGFNQAKLRMSLKSSASQQAPHCEVVIHFKDNERRHEVRSERQDVQGGTYAY